MQALGSNQTSVAGTFATHSERFDAVDRGRRVGNLQDAMHNFSAKVGKTDAVVTEFVEEVRRMQALTLDMQEHLLRLSLHGALVRPGGPRADEQPGKPSASRSRAVEP